MKYKSLLITFLAIILFGCATHRTYMGYRVIDMPFKIAGGETIILPVTDAGPIPAENDFFKIEVAGFSASPSIEDASKAALVWNFSLTSKKSMNLEHVYIEQVSPGENSVRVVIDESPSLNGGTWSGRTLPKLIDSVSTPWLYEPGASIFVFKIIIKAKGLDTIILYQPSWFADQSKAVFRNMASKKNG